MNTKILLAFAGGLIVASGITYIAMRRPATPPPSPAAAEAAHTATAPATLPPTEPITDATPAAPAQEEAAPSKPSPKVARAERPRIREQAHTTQPAQPAPPPAPAVAPPANSPPPQETASNTPARVGNAPPPDALAPPPPERKVEPPPPPQPHTVTIPAGTTLSVRLGETLSTQRSRAGDTFTATLDQPLVVDGFVIAERGARAQGRVVESDPAGRVHGLAQLSLELTQINTSDGQKVRVNTAAFKKQAESTKKKDATKVGIGAALGAAIGAIAGGGKGAAIGAGVGGAAGAGDVMLTRGQAAEVPVETRLTFRLSEPVTITEKL
jgi:hypothetical protein